MDINTMDLKDLKALGYDMLSNIQRLQNQLQIVNNKIGEKSKPEEAKGENKTE